MIEKGYKVAICEQMEDPALAKGLVQRDVIRVVTPGTVIESGMLDERSNNFLLSVCFSGEKAGLAFADVSTGEFFVHQVEDAGRTLADRGNPHQPGGDHRQRSEPACGSMSTETTCP